MSTSLVPLHDGSHFHTHRWPAYTPTDSTTPSTPTSSRPPRALLILLHGFAEHIERYDHVWSPFSQAGIEVFGYDQRGYGRTAEAATKANGGKEEYGNTSLGELLSDVAWVVKEERRRLDVTWAGQARVPIWLYGHSMGGGIVLTFLSLPHLASTDISDGVDLVDGVIASSPWITLTNPPDPITRLAAPLVLRLLPNLPHTHPIDATTLSHDPAIASSYTSDPYISGKVKMKTILGSLVTGPKLLSTGVRHWPARVPLLVTHGVEDQVTSAKGSKEFVEGIKKHSAGREALDVEWKGWDNMMHEGHNELPPVRDAFLRYTVEWIVQRTESPSSSINTADPVRSNL